MKAGHVFLRVLLWEQKTVSHSLAKAFGKQFKVSAKDDLHAQLDLAKSADFDVLIINGIQKNAKAVAKEVRQAMPVVYLHSGNGDKAIKDYEITDVELPITDLNITVLEEVIKITVEKFRTERKLKQISERSSYLGRVTNDILWDWDLKSGYLYYNSEGWVKIIGRDRHEGKITFENWLHFVHPDDRDLVRDQFNNIIKDPHTLNFEVEYRMVSQTGFIYVMERGFVERDSKGIAYRLLGSTQDVNARKVAEDELKKLSMVVRETVYGVFITDKDCHITWVNEAFTNLTGYTLEDAKGKVPYKFLFVSQDKPEDCNEFEQKMVKAEPFEHSMAVKRKKGKLVWVQINCQPQYDIRNNHVGFFAIIADVTAQKNAEEKLIQNEKKFRVLVENIQDGVALVGKNGEVMEFFSGQKMLGYSLEDYKKGRVKKNVHPDYRGLVQKALDEVIDNPEVPSKIEFRVKKKNGDYTWIEAVFYNLLNEDPLYAILANFREIRESKHAEELLKLSEKKYRNLFNNNPLAMFVWDPANFRILEANDAASIQYGYDGEELKQMKINQLIHPDMEERLKAVARSSRANSKFRTSYLTKHLDKEGKLMHMEVAFHPIDYFGSQASMAIVKNITEQVELERRLAREREQKQQEITLAAITAQEQERLHIGRELHDNINQILATVRLYIEYALSHPAMHDQLLKSAKELVLSAVNEIRNLSKSLLPPSVGEKGLAATLDDLFNSIRKINKYTFNTEWDMDEDKLPENLKLTVFRIIQEQLNNIFKHARAKKIDASITMNDGELVVKVSDDGRGFDPAVNGKGVGLKNIRSRAELHQGNMSLKTVEGKGTELTVSFILND